MGFIRIGEKMISRSKIDRFIEEILDLRNIGFSQQETAKKVGIDRTFVSRLEKLGEVRKGKRLAVLGFPILNKNEVEEICHLESVDFSLIMTEKERWAFLEKKSGLELFNELMDLIYKVRECDLVILLLSDKRAKLIRSLLESEVMQITLGQSPLSEDQYVVPKQLRDLIISSKEGLYETSS